MRRFTTIASIIVAAIALPIMFEIMTRAAEDGFEPYVFESSSGEKVKAELGRFTVKENRSAEDSRSIQIVFVRFKSTSKSPGPPIVYLAGGPGGSGIGTARGTRFPLFMAMRELGDVIALDQRGTGMTGFEELDCDDRYEIPYGEPLDREKGGRIIAQVTNGCVQRLRSSGVDLSAYNTRESAADLEDLRKFLGVEKISLWGISYGTHLALAAMKNHGDGIDRVILAGLEGPDDTYKLPSDQQELLERIAEITAKDSTVAAVVPDLLGSIERLLKSLEAEPRTVRLTHPMTGEETDVRVGASDLQLALAHMLRGPSRFSIMPDLISRLERGDWTSLALASGQARNGEGLHGMSLAMDCASGASSARLERIAREAKMTMLGDAINAPFPEVCEGQGIPDLGDGFRGPVISNLPALLISGTLDGRTSVKNGEKVMAGLSNAHHLIIEGAGHSDPLFLSSPKILEAMMAFMRGEKVPYEKINLPPVKLIPPREVVTLDDEALSRYVGTYRIKGDDMRKVMKVGNILWTQRTGSIPLPIRPSSETEFFYEGFPFVVTFETNPRGKVTGMVMHDDPWAEGEPAKKIR